jgi:hypothetical protein
MQLHEHGREPDRFGLRVGFRIAQPPTTSLLSENEPSVTVIVLMILPSLPFTRHRLWSPRY